MICRKCQTDNPDTSVYCSECTAPLLRRPKPKRIQIAKPQLLVGATGLLACLAILYFALFRSPHPDSAGETGFPDETASSPPLLKTGPTSLVVGEAAVFNFSDREVSRWTVAVFDDGWIALPVAGLLGGNSIFFQSGDSGLIRSERAVWSSGAPVAFFQVEAEPRATSPEVAAWKPKETLIWRPLDPAGQTFQVEIVRTERAGPLIAFSLPEEMKIPGILVQAGRIVGWTFGNALDRGYLWMSSGDGGLGPGISIDQLVAVLSSSREADFDRALAMSETTPELERLAMFAHGFLNPQIMAAEDLPSPLRMDNIAREMHALATVLIREGRADEVVRILDFNVLMESSEPLLVQDAVQAMVEAKDHYRGIQYLETIKNDYFAARGRLLGGLEPFHAQLYKDWLKKLIAEGGYFSAVSAAEIARKTFPDDPEIHLLGVEAALAEEDYIRAQELLAARSYPGSFNERVMKLESQVKVKREESEALTIRFNPGEAHIPVYADLNGRYRQEFIIDTGANICTIPSSALEPLGIEIDDRTTVKRVEGIGGTGLVYEVTLESVALDGWNVKNVQALIIDLAAYPDCGLLGLNFLNHFRYEIDKQKGILRLNRR